MEPTTASIDSFLQRYTTDKFGFTHKNVQFIGLNSQLINSGLEREKTQFDWLKACMTKHPSMRKVVFTHQPFYTKNPEEKDTYDNIAQPKRMEYLQLLKANGVVSVFSGHFHKNAENQYPGMDLVISSAVGKALGTEGSGLRIVQVYKDSIAHHFIELSKLTE
jgi:3',5'-cyclic AMP phosphodiesterase CpdA